MLNTRLIFILVCAALVAVYLQASAGVVAVDVTDVMSWFDGR